MSKEENQGMEYNRLGVQYIMFKRKTDFPVKYTNIAVHSHPLIIDLFHIAYRKGFR